MQVKKTDLADFEYHDSILYVKAKKRLLELKDMQVMLKDAVELVGGEKYYAIIDTSEQSDSTSEARKYYTESEYSKYRYADAFVVKSMALKMIVNFYLQMLAPPVPSKMFNSIEDARFWIEELREKRRSRKSEHSTK